MQGKRTVGVELEQLRKKIWDFRARGLSLSVIGQAVNLSESAVSKHLKVARLEEYAQVSQARLSDRIGGHLLWIRRLKEEALNQMQKADPGSLPRRQWMETLASRVKEDIAFQADMGLLPKGSNLLELNIKDVRSMSVEELRSSIEGMERKIVNKVKEEPVDYAKMASLGEQGGSR